MTHENADTMINYEILSTETAKIQNQTVHSIMILLQIEPQEIDSQMKHSHFYLSCP